MELKEKKAGHSHHFRHSCLSHCLFMSLIGYQVWKSMFIQLIFLLFIQCELFIQCLVGQLSEMGGCRLLLSEKVYKIQFDEFLCCVLHM